MFSLRVLIHFFMISNLWPQFTCRDQRFEWVCQLKVWRLETVSAKLLNCYTDSSCAVTEKLTISRWDACHGMWL